MVSYICPIFRIATQTFLLPCGTDQFTVLILKFGIEAQKIVLISVHCQGGKGLYPSNPGEPARDRMHFFIGELKQLHALRRRRQLQKTINLMIKRTALHVHHAFGTFLQTFTARLRRETP